MESNELNVRHCNTLVKRFACLRFASGLTAVGLQELADALLAASRDRDQASQIVDSWIREHAEYPTPADLYQLSRATTEAKQLPPPCDKCFTLPGYIRQEVVIKRGVFAGETREALDFCSCPRGEMLREGAMKYKREESKFEDDTKVESNE